MEQIPDELLLDIGISPLDPNLQKADAANAKKLIVPDVRNAESRFIAYQLKDTLELTGNWGAVRVIPDPSDAVDLKLQGKILVSDGEQLKLWMQAVDSAGKVWLKKEYRDTASKFSYRSPKEDPFQDLYNDIANDLLLARQKFTAARISRIRQISSLKYARNLSPEAFGDYLVENRSGKVDISQLPASNNEMLTRVDRIKQQEYLFVDTLDDYYAHFHRDMKASYDEWRHATYDEAVRLRQMQKQARNRLIGGAALIAGGIVAANKSETWAGDAAATGAVLGGIGAIKSGLDRRKEAEIHAESLKELSQSLGSEITPYVLDIEGKTIELTGTADAQYQQWRRILGEIYVEETGLPVE
ncbi:MAG: hypothetical protein CMQ20_17285 [Gammaproteobacteria bacterium]|jgi:hypothetical protein|nr:hypothetical protein [Gammaproteobacteria bacterium]|tara:strand:+ start:630 stop:1700 length:1071 start_codon:yes stop_codon:yes gene_type:complete